VRGNSAAPLTAARTSSSDSTLQEQTIMRPGGGDACLADRERAAPMQKENRLFEAIPNWTDRTVERV
jgi:hypothetical protein